MNIRTHFAGLAALTVAASQLTANAATPRLKVHPDALMLRMKREIRREPVLSQARTLSLLRQHVKYLFVIYQENRSFDSYFGTFPGADGLFSHPANETPGFYQPILNTDGTTAMVHPFRIGPSQQAADTDDIDHSHGSIVAKIKVQNGKPLMNRFALTEERRFSPTGNPSLRAKQMGELAMAYEDGDTIPFLWRYANRFVLCDHIFQQITGPSTPGNLAIIAAQTGVTQWMLHPDEADGKLSGGRGVPVIDDHNPFWGSALDPTTKNRMPYAKYDSKDKNPQINLTFASLPLSLARGTAASSAKHDTRPGEDLADVEQDIKALQKHGGSAIDWGWYEEGYDQESPSEGPLDASGATASYITHHNGPQYFGYIANNPLMRQHLHGLDDLYKALAANSLHRGIFYVKGGYLNNVGLKPECTTGRAATNFLGDDDHPGYSDSRISESMVAATINRIANSKYWKHCAIVITWDDSEGDYDSVPPPGITVGPDGQRLTDGPRVPFLLISPYSRVNFVDHEVGNQSSVVRLADELFSLTPLAKLPDEERGVRIGMKQGLKNEGPTDANPLVSGLLNAFDPARLTGAAAPLPAYYATIPQALIETQPSELHFGLQQIGVLPTDYAKGIANHVPADFNPRPETNPTPVK